MPFPSTGPATLPLVKAQLGITDALDDDALTAAVEAVNQVVLELRVAQAADTEPAPVDWEAWPRIVQGAVMLSARVFRRRNTPDGVAALADQGPVYVQRNDPDVAMLLQLGAWSKPSVG